MAWFKPARNRDHPGDPPPKWAPIGKAGRAALVVTVIVGIVIALLIIATRSAEATDGTDAANFASEPPSSAYGQRVEVPAAGLAVTFPADWVIEFAGEGSDRLIMVLAQPDRFGPEVDLQELLVTKSPDMVAKSPDMLERDRATGCTLVRYAPIDLTADEFLREVFEPSSQFTVESIREGLSRVLVNPFLQSRIMTDVPDAFYVDHYAIAHDDAIAVLWCTGVISHREVWLAIAESVESLPEEA